MSYRKFTAILFLSAVGLLQTACFPIESARSSNQTAINQPSESRQTANVEPNKSPETKSEKSASGNSAETSATPKSKSKADNFVCPEPNLPCNHAQKEFDEWELSFRLPAKIVPNRTYKSAPFYAVILKKYDDGCDDLDVNPTAEPERQRIQKLFPSRKVFAEYSCPNMSAVNYAFAGKLSADGERFLYMDYIAVYAGVDEAEGKEIFDLLKKDYRQAELKRMTAEYGEIEQ